MKYRRLDANGDFVLGGSNDFYINSPATVAQAVRTRLLLFLGEWFLDTTDGLPWNTQVLGKYNQRAYDTVIKQRILETQGVKSILSYVSNLNPVKRLLTVNATIDTIYGETLLVPKPVAGNILDQTFVLDVSKLG